MRASTRFRALAGASRAELEAILRDGTTPALESLHGQQYIGFNQPRSTELIRSRKFFKGFFPADGRTLGFNIKARQNGLGGDWVPRGANADPFAFYSVKAVRDGVDAKYSNSLLLDYSEGGNGAFDPAKRLRDYLVRVDPASDDLLLGKAYMAIAAARVSVGFFFLERHMKFEVSAQVTDRFS